MVREFLAEVNLQTGRAENRFNLLQLDQQLVFRPGEQVVSPFFIISLRFPFRELGVPVAGLLRISVGWVWNLWNYRIYG